jgi:hypothetical protein
LAGKDVADAKVTIVFKPHPGGGVYADFHFEGKDWNGFARNVVVKNFPREYKRYQAEIARQKGVREECHTQTTLMESQPQQQDSKQTLELAIKQAMKVSTKGK